MAAYWRNTYYAVVDGAVSGTDRPCFSVIKLSGEDTGKYGFSEEKAIEIAKRLTHGTCLNAEAPSCTGCTDRFRMNHHHVYVIELDPRILSERKRRLLKRNPEAETDAPCFYVGSTLHKCECRFEQHRLYAQRADSFPCRCYKGMLKTRQFHVSKTDDGRTKGSRLAGTYAVRLRPDIYAHLNPISHMATARKVERELAVRIRENGAVVLQG